jgi:uncharacterized membrane protein
MWIAAVALIVGGVAVTAAAAMARAGRLSRQSWVGIRTRTTLASDEAWDAAHRAGASWVMVGGIIMALGGLLTFLTESEGAATTVALVSVVVALVPILIGGVLGQAAARRVT